MKRIFTFLLCLLLCATAFTGCAEMKEKIRAEIELAQVYYDAKHLIKQGQIEQAYEMYLTIQDYRDVSEILECFVFRPHYYISEGTRVCMEYDSYGRLVKKEYFDYFPDEPYMTKLYEYDKQGRVVKYTHLYRNEPEEITQLSYDMRGNVVKVIEPDESLQIYTYDIQGRLLHEAYVTASGYAEKEVKYEYNDRDHSYVQQTWVYTHDSYYSAQYWLDENDNIVKRITSNDVVEEWDYNEQGQIIKYRTEDSIFKSIRETTYTYDKYGGLASSVHVYHYLQDNRSDQTYTTWHRRFYDQYGNLMSEKVEKSSAGGDSYIEYYDYRRYYDPCGVSEIPEEYLDK